MIVYYLVDKVNKEASDQKSNTFFGPSDRSDCLSLLKKVAYYN